MLFIQKIVWSFFEIRPIVEEKNKNKTFGTFDPTKLEKKCISHPFLKLK